MPASPFLDTNVLLYSIAEGDPRTEAAEALLTAGGIVSVQVLNEFVATARRKLAMSWDEIAEAVGAVRVLCPSPVAITVETHDAALRLAERYGFHFYDALVVASALGADCETLYTEDLQDGQVVDDRLTIRNPFKPSQDVT
jgi:predicted nucleic acid-binding protein